MAQQQIKAETGALGSDGDLQVYQVPGSVIVTPYSASAVFDGSGAAGSFIPCLTFKTQTGAIIARCPAPEVAAGDTAEVSWFPHVAQPGGGLLPPVVPVSGFDAYAVYTAGQTGTFAIPAKAKIFYVVLVGAGGGGGGGVAQFWVDAARLSTLNPAGVAFTVGTNGKGATGVNTNAGSSGTDGTATTFGGWTAGGGSGGRAGGGGGGGGSSYNSASASTTGGSPTVVAGGSAVGPQSVTGNAVSGGGSGAAEYGGSAGGTSASGSGVVGGGMAGGSSVYGGPGGGGGGGIGVSPQTVGNGGKGGLTFVYAPITVKGTGSGADGTFTGPWCGTGGDGGASTTSVAGGNGGKGSVAGGGGGGGSIVTNTSTLNGGNGGDGGGGRIYIYAFG